MFSEPSHASKNLLSRPSTSLTPITRGVRHPSVNTKMYSSGLTVTRYTPANPADSPGKSLINSEYWDPLMRAGDL